MDAVELATAEWVDWYNHRRLHEYAGDITPVELENHSYDQAQQPVGQSNQGVSGHASTVDLDDAESSWD